MAKDFILKTDGDLATYLGNFQIQVSVVGPILRLSAAKIAAATEACIDTCTKIEAAAVKKNESQQATAEKQSSRKNTIALISKFARRIEAHPTYDAAKGKLQNIIREDETGKDISLYWATIIPLGILIDFFPKFQFDGVNV
jgi:hypothetical protein